MNAATSGFDDSWRELLLPDRPFCLIGGCPNLAEYLVKGLASEIFDYAGVCTEHARQLYTIGPLEDLTQIDDYLLRRNNMTRAAWLRSGHAMGGQNPNDQ
jgi:hypothetical protein